MRAWLTCLVAASFVPAAVPSHAEVEIREWPVPWKDTRPRDPAVDRHGRVWFVGQTGDYVGWFDPGKEEFGRFELGAGAGPHNVIVTPSGEIWFSANRAGYIGRLDPSDGSVVKVPMPAADAGDPHTLVTGPDGAIWFTVQAGGYVGKLDPRTRAVRLLKVPARGARPYGIVIAADGTPWFNEFGTNAVGSIDPRTMTLVEHRLPDPAARSRRIALGEDGGIWYVDYARGFLGRLDPKSGKVEEWQTPGGAGSLPYAMTADDRGRLWLVETGPQPNRLVGFDPQSRRFLSPTPIPSGGSTVRHMVFDARSRSIWFGTDKGTIGQARLR